MHATALDLSLRDTAGDATNQRLCVTPVRIAFRVVDREVGSRDAPGSAQLADEARELLEVEPRITWRIDSGHHRLIEDVEIDVQPGLVEPTRLESCNHLARGGLDALL